MKQTNTKPSLIKIITACIATVVGFLFIVVIALGQRETLLVYMDLILAFVFLGYSIFRIARWGKRAKAAEEEAERLRKTHCVRTKDGLVLYPPITLAGLAPLTGMRTELFTIDRREVQQMASFLLREGFSDIEISALTSDGQKVVWAGFRGAGSYWHNVAS